MAIRAPRGRPTPSLYGQHDLTVEDWFTLPEDGRQYELLEGVLVVVPPPSRSHQDIAGELFHRLKSHISAHGAYAGIAPLGVALSEHVGFEPDVVYVRPGREQILTPRGVEGVPDLVIEVLSPSTRAFDRGTKLRTYLEHGVPEIWLVAPERRLTTVYRPGEASVECPFGSPVASTVVEIGDAGLR
jgi:Uma2 family endonuclease